MVQNTLDLNWLHLGLCREVEALYQKNTKIWTYLDVMYSWMDIHSKAILYPKILPIDTVGQFPF